MNIELIREVFAETHTIGKLYINGEYFCDTLEDKDRGLDQSMTESEIKNIKVKGSTAIPTGVYKVVNSFSPRFKKYLPLLLNVKGYTGIRIHPGNSYLDTEGCLLLGIRNKELDKVLQSKITFTKFFTLLKKAEKISPIILTIKRQQAN